MSWFLAALLSGKSSAGSQDCGGPVLRGGLTEELHGRIPGAADAILKPTPVGGEREQEQGRKTQRAGQVGCRVVDGDDLIHRGNLGGETVDVSKLVDTAIDKERCAGVFRLAFQGVEFAVLQADPADARQREERSKLGQVDGALAAGFRVPGLPGETNQAAAVRVVFSKMRARRSRA